MATLSRTPSNTPPDGPPSTTSQGRPSFEGASPAQLPLQNRLINLGRSVAAIAGDLELSIRQSGVDLIEVVEQAEALRELLGVVVATAKEGIAPEAEEQ